MPAAGLANPFGIEDDEEFAKLMQAGMADLLGGPKPKPKTTLDPNNIFAEMVKEMSSVAHSDGPEADALREALGITKEDTIIPPSSETEPGGAKAQSAFQQTIRQTIERMQESGAAAGAAAASSSKPEDDYLAALLRDLENGDTGASGDGDDDFSKLLMGVMQQLTNKDILYEPMKDMNDKFPDWMEKNKGKHSDEDMKRYAEQQTLASEIVAKFEEPNYRDSKVEDREYIVDKMGKVSLDSNNLYTRDKLNDRYRCKQLARLLLTWLEIWQPLKTHWVTLIPAVRNNEVLGSPLYTLY